MEPQLAEVPAKHLLDRHPGIFIFTVSLLAIVGIFVIAKVFADRPLKHDLDLCDKAIMAGLKAPSTYKRVETPQPYSADNFSYLIEYDAENSYGTPLRHSGICNLDESRKSATWSDFGAHGY